MNRVFSVLFAAVLFALPAAAQFDATLASSVQRRPVHLAPVQAAPIAPYTIDTDIWPPLDTVQLGEMPVSRPSLFVGSVTIDHGYYTQNRWSPWISEYKVYTANFVRFGVNAASVCTQFCGQVNWGNGSIYALAPFSGTYHDAPVPTPANCDGITPNSDWHFQRAAVTFPVSIDLYPGTNPVTVWPVGGMATWNDEVQSGPTHAYALDIVVHTIEVQGFILARPIQP